MKKILSLQKLSMDNNGGGGGNQSTISLLLCGDVNSNLSLTLCV